MHAGYDTQQTHMEGLVRVGDERDEDREDHIDEQSDKNIEIDFGEDVSCLGSSGHPFVCSEHIISIDQGE